MSRPEFAPVEDDDELAPVVEEMPGSRRADAADYHGLELSFHGLELMLRQLKVPGMPVANLDIDEARRAQGRGALSERGHVVGNAFEAKELQHLGRVIAAAAAQPVARDEAAAGPQDPQDFGKYRRFVGNLDQGVLGKNHVETCRGERQRPRLHFDAAHPACESRALGPDSQALQQHGIDVDPDHRRGSVLGNQEFVYGAETAADVENFAAANVAALEYAGNLIGAAWGQKTVTPDDLQHRQHALVVFAGLARLANFCGFRSAHPSVISASNDFAPYTFSRASRMMAGCRAMARFFAVSNQ